MEFELRESEVEANEVIGQWQENCAATESKCTSIEEELNHLKAANQTQGISPMHKDIDEANYSKIVKTLAQKEEELQRLNKEAELSNRSLQKLKGTVYKMLSYFFYIIRSFVTNHNLIFQLMILLYRRCTGAEPTNRIRERGACEPRS